jgi:hypothetical protein
MARQHGRSSRQGIPEGAGIASRRRVLTCRPVPRTTHLVLKGAAALLALLLSALAGGPRVIVGEEELVRSDAPAVVRPLTAEAVAAAPSQPAGPCASERRAGCGLAAVNRSEPSATRPCGAGGGPRAPC